MSPPLTHQQWLDCLRKLEARPWDRETLEAVRHGRCSGSPTEAFLVRLSDSVGVMLSRCTERFLQELDQALADGEPDLAPLLASRFQKRVKACLFYRQLDFLDTTYINTLDEGFEKQIRSFWQQFLLQLKKTVGACDDPACEDMEMELRRIKITAFGRS